MQAMGESASMSYLFIYCLIIVCLYEEMLHTEGLGPLLLCFNR